VSGPCRGCKKNKCLLNNELQTWTRYVSKRGNKFARCRLASFHSAPRLCDAPGVLLIEAKKPYFKTDRNGKYIASYNHGSE